MLKQKQNVTFQLYFSLYPFYIKDNLFKTAVAMSKYIKTCIKPTEVAVFKHPYPAKSLIWIGASPDVAG